MNTHKLKYELRCIANITEKHVNEEYNEFGLKFRFNISPHVADRLIDRSTNVVRDLRNINYIMQQIRKNYVCNLLYYVDNTHRLVVFSEYKNLANQCFALGCTVYKNDDSVIIFTVRTFIPDFRKSSLSNKEKLCIKEPKKTFFDVNSDVQKFIYSPECPEVLHKLRG